MADTINGGGGSSSIQQIDYTDKFNEIISALNKQATQVFTDDQSFIKYVAARLFANVSFDLDHRPYYKIANECVSKAKALVAACKKV